MAARAKKQDFYIEKSGPKRVLRTKKVFDGHAKQQEVWNCESRFIDIMAGRRGGKDHVGVRKAIKNIIRDAEQNKFVPHGSYAKKLPGLHYWFIAPTYSITRVIIKHFLRSIPDWWIRENNLNSPSPHVWLYPNILIEFKSANNPNTLVGEGLHGVYITETARLKANVWNDNMRPALADYQGWGIFTTTPLGHNWYIDQIREKAESDKPEDSEFKAFYWKSIDNDRMPNLKKEVEQAKKTMPLKYFLRNFEASPDAFFGQIYEDFNPDIHIQTFDIRRENYKYIVSGIDWGYVHNGVNVVFGITHDDCVDLIDIESKPNVPAISSDPEIESWQSISRKLYAYWGIEEMYGGVDQPDHINEFQRDGMPMFNAYNSVDAGIQFVAQLMHVVDGHTRFRIHSNFSWLKKKITAYSWRYNEKEDTYLAEPNKKDDDECDAIRYALYSAYRRGLIQLSEVERDLFNKYLSDGVDD